MVMETLARFSLKELLQSLLHLFAKDKLNAGNKSVVNKFESELTHDVKSLCNTVAASMYQQNKQLQCIEKFCHTFFNINDKGIIDLRKKVAASRALYVSHIEELQNVVLLHKANSNASLEEVQSLVSSNASSVEELLVEEAAGGLSIFDELQNSLSSQQGEMAHFSKELRQVGFFLCKGNKWAS